MAVSGESLCTSCWNGFLLSIKHGAKFAFANFIARLFILVGKIAIVTVNCFTCYFIMKNVTLDTEELDSIVAPIAAVAIVSFMAASIFLSLFDEAVLALVTCLCIDTDLNGTAQFGPPTFYDEIKFFGGNKEKKKNLGDDVEEETLDN